MRLLTLARDLQRRKARERHGLFVAEGVRTVEELLASPIGARGRLRGALASPVLDATPRGAALRARLVDAGVPVLDVSERDFATAADTDSPQGVLAVAERPATAEPAALASRLSAEADARAGDLRVLVLDGVQDPGNAGTILRSAAGLGAAAVVALGGTVDPWSAKVVRASMGAGFRLPILPASPEALDAFLAAGRIVLWGADGAGESVDASASDAPTRLAIAVGNEGAGLSTAVRDRAARLVAVPSTALVESLNVAVAASILLYALRPAALRR